jgi:hypothetical protein
VKSALPKSVVMMTEYPAGESSATAVQTPHDIARQTTKTAVENRIVFSPLS